MIDTKDVLVTVRDGVKLGVRIYRPEGGGKFPALFAASPYRYDNNELPAQPSFLWRETGPIDWYVGQGYAYVHADVRGTGISEGEFRFLDRKEQTDLYDVIEWIAAQSWCNGKVGGIGQSYYAMLQWFMGIQNPPHLACLGLYDGLNDPYRYMGYPGGIEGNFLPYWFNSSVRVANFYPANGNRPRQMTYDMLLDVQRHPFYDDYWKERSAIERLDQITVPVFSIGVFAKQDLHLDGNIRGWQRIKGPKKLAITGTATAFSSAVDFADVEFHKKYLLPFYGVYLKGEKTGFDARPAVEYALKGGAGTRSFDTWPPPGIRPQSFYLSAGPSGSVSSLNDGALIPEAPSAGAGATSYFYPNPKWVLGVACMGPAGPDPLRAVLTFASAPLAADLEIAGNGKLVVFASSTRNDMDFLIKVSEQFPQAPEERAKGLQPRSVIVTKGWLRASHSERDPARSTELAPYYTHARSEKLAPGKIYRIEIPLEPIAHIFRKGSRIRLDLACGDSPVTDGLFSHLYRPDKIGADTLYHDAAHPSQLILPVLPTR
jgi:putative CocE/NonD family hydrolase